MATQSNPNRPEKHAMTPQQLHISDSPYRRNVSSFCSSPPSTGLTLDDIEGMLARRERAGYTTGYAERDETARDQLETAYDDGWRAGVLARHRATSDAFGARVRAAAEFARLHSAEHDRAQVHANPRDVLDLLADVLESLVEEHDAGPFMLARDPRPGPAPEISDPVSLEALGVEVEADHARAGQLQDWLLMAVRLGQNSEPDDEDVA